MKTLEWTATDKSTWPHGPWQSEPDKRQWTDLQTNYPCLIVRNHFGALCGYVGVTLTHPTYGHCYKDNIITNISVHGGVTYTGPCQKSNAVSNEKLICHIPDADEPDNIWWIGFDCAHYSDFLPNYPSNYMFLPLNHETYRNIDFVTHECESLAKQLKQLEP